MNAVAILQARMSSSRLPGKALLPIGGMPAVVLAARRAGNRGCEVRVATSTESSDHVLADTMAEAGITCFRGSLNDVLGRFVEAIADIPDDVVVVRLTADNMLPDGELIDVLTREFLATKAAYLVCGGPGSGLPYGITAELIRARDLREAAARTTQAYDREHVTPYVRRYREISTSAVGLDVSMEHYRCTIDGFDDYQSVAWAFRGLDDPVRAGWREIISRLRKAPFQPVISRAVSELVVGGAQFGMPYGIANADGQPDDAVVSALLKKAIINGAGWVDTANAYGASETVIGQALLDGWRARVRIITKLNPLQDCPPDADGRLVVARVDASVFESLAALRTKRLDALLLHRASHLDLWGGAARIRLLEHQALGRIGALGVSVGSPAELERALAEPTVSHIQVPINLLDHRWGDLVPAILQTKSRRELIIHSRSVFLQGLLLHDDQALWRRAHLDTCSDVGAWLDEMTRRFDRLDRSDLCLAYVRSLSFVDGIVIGMETEAQLQCNLARFDRPCLTLDQRDALEASRPKLEACSLDPSQWMV